MKRKIQWWNAGVGAMDACTGLLLLFVPALTLRLMGLQPVGAEARIFLSWMGAFVFGVGASYFFAWRVRSPEEGEMIWKMTALVRAVIAVFVIAQVSRGTLEPWWLSVAATDAFVALVQFVGLKRSWWQK